MQPGNHSARTPPAPVLPRISHDSHNRPGGHRKTYTEERGSIWLVKEQNNKQKDVRAGEGLAFKRESA